MQVSTLPATQKKEERQYTQEEIDQSTHGAMAILSQAGVATFEVCSACNYCMCDLHTHTHFLCMLYTRVYKLLLRMACSMQAAQGVPLPDSPMRATSTQAPSDDGLWTTRTEFQKFCKDAMSISLFQDPHIRLVIVQQADTESTISNLTDRLQRETEQDFIQFTEKKLDIAKLRLKELQDEFEGSHVGDLLSRCNEYSRSMNGPLFEPADLF